ncbi:Y-family DNA polymerase [Allohahella sp. A8]|uniref:Y-family DNA polymerase n=1 Tax=Allohahella sp. A8 TaxID=3141461 RepID=UPI003A80E5A5
MHWLYLHLPHLFAEHSLPEFRSEQPVIVVTQDGRQVIDINAAAQQAGLETAMTSETACCLCPAVRVVKYSAATAFQALRHVAIAALAESAWVSPDAPDGLYMEVGSMRRLKGDYAAQIAFLHEFYAELGYTVHIAQHSRARAARILARQTGAAAASEPDALIELRHLPVTVLSLSAAMVKRLHKLGLKTLGDLNALDTGELNYRLGASLDEVDFIFGRRQWLPEPFYAPESFDWSQSFEHDIEQQQALFFPISQGIRTFCQFLRLRCLSAQRLILVLRFRERERHPARTLQINLAEAENSTESWLYMLKMTLERCELPAPVVAASLHAGGKHEAELIPVEQKAAVLWEAPTDQIRARQTRLLNRLAARLGEHHLLFPRCVHDPRPERQSIYASSIVQSTETAAITQLSGRTRPLWLTPVTPLVFSSRAMLSEFRIIHGPVQIHTGWWDDEGCYRNYYISRLPGGSLCWIFFDKNQQCFSQGLFA